MKYFIILVVLLLGLAIFKYWPSAKGLYTANKPASKEIKNSINNSPVNTGLRKQNNSGLPLRFPEGYDLSIYAKDLSNPRDLEIDSIGNLLVSIPGKNQVAAIVDGKAKVLASNLNKPHGLAFSGNRLYVAETDQVKVFEYSPEEIKLSGGKKILDLPGGGGHYTRSVIVKGDRLYTSIGSSCNVCEEKDPRRAAIWVSNLDGSDFKPFATGLRNSVFMTLDPSGSEIWATNHGRDNLGDDLPPETVNLIKEGGNYGWPYCYGNKITDNETNKDNSKFDCSKMEAPKIEFQAHSAPLGISFLGNDILVAYHGSWNRSVPTGYKVVKFVNGKPFDFVTGWFDGGEVWGRPADVLVKDSGRQIFISDDKAGLIYLLTKI